MCHNTELSELTLSQCSVVPESETDGLDGDAQTLSSGRGTSSGPGQWPQRGGASKDRRPPEPRAGDAEAGLPRPPARKPTGVPPFLTAVLEDPPPRCKILSGLMQIFFYFCSYLVFSPHSEQLPFFEQTFPRTPNNGFFLLNAFLSFPLIIQQ